MWKPTKKWGPPRATGSSPIAVEKVGAEEELGLAKQRGMLNEKLASDLAAMVQVRVPKVDLDEIEGKSGLCAISRVHGAESNDLAAVKQHAADVFNSPKVQEAIKRASGLLAFYAWTGTGDQKDDHLVLDTTGGGQYHVTGVDFESAFSWGGEADGGQIHGPGVPPAMAPNIDKAQVSAVVTAIESATDDQIRAAVGGLPDALVSAQEKQRIATGLIGRKRRVRERMKAQGWLD
jgi:hypothetical protein